jgi:hypothetical protein
MVRVRVRVKVRVRVRVAVRAAAALQCLDGIYSRNNKGQWTPERNGIGHTQGSASSGGAKA